MYHYVRARGEPLSRGVRGLSPSAFEEQLDALSRWGEPLSWEAFAPCLCGKVELPRRSFLLTFDDGLLDHVEVAAPILGADLPPDETRARRRHDGEQFLAPEQE